MLGQFVQMAETLVSDGLDWTEATVIGALCATVILCTWVFCASVAKICTEMFNAVKILFELFASLMNSLFRGAKKLANSTADMMTQGANNGPPNKST